MLTRKEALYYDEQLHPAFAGYLHDGTITQRDALAAIFHLLTKGILNPVWKDNSMLEAVVGIKKTKRRPILSFDQVLINMLFGSKDFISSEEVKKTIQEKHIQRCIQDNLHAITTFPIINQELLFTLKGAPVKFTLNDEPVDTIEEAVKLKKWLYYLFLPVFLGGGLIALLMGVFYNQLFSKGPGLYKYGPINVDVTGSAFTAFFVGFVFITVILFITLAFTFSKKVINYDFQKDVVPIAKKKYTELYEFIKAHPLPKHRFINEFLAFSIAFGLDDSWHKDFRLDQEIKIDLTPLNRN